MNLSRFMFAEAPPAAKTQSGYDAEPMTSTDPGTSIGALRFLGPPVQVAYAVRDTREAAAQWATDRGAGPFFLIDHIELTNVRYRGSPAVFDHSSAYGQWGPIMLELICDHTNGPSPVADVVGPGGCGLHHIAHMVPQFSSACGALTDAGYAQALYANTAAGMPFAFHDATSTLGHMIEVYEETSRLRSFYAMVADAATNWDGSNPVRTLSPTR